MLLDQTHYLRLLKHNYDGITLVQPGGFNATEILEIDQEKLMFHWIIWKRKQLPF